MARLRVSTIVDAPVDRVWDDLRQLGRHVEWMVDAEEIRFVTAETEGVGTTFECDTKVGPFRLTDVMEITKWQPGQAIGVRHTGIVTGDGVLSMSAKRKGQTKVVWRERLIFPWWMGGPVGAQVAAPVLKVFWRRSMANLAARF